MVATFQVFSGHLWPVAPVAAEHPHLNRKFCWSVQDPTWAECPRPSVDWA